MRGVSITPYCGKIQDKDDDYYMQFDIVVCGLDSIEARRWINNQLCSMVDMRNIRSMKPLVDGGTEGMGAEVEDVRSCIAEHKQSLQVSKVKRVSSTRRSLRALNAS